MYEKKVKNMNKLMMMIMIAILAGCSGKQIGCATGAVAGGVAGYQYTGSDKGQSIATAVGAGAGCAGGAWVGNEIEENQVK